MVAGRDQPLNLPLACLHPEASQLPCCWVGLGAVSSSSGTLTLLAVAVVVTVHHRRITINLRGGGPLAPQPHTCGVDTKLGSWFLATLLVVALMRGSCCVTFDSVVVVQLPPQQQLNNLSFIAMHVTSTRGAGRQPLHGLTTALIWPDKRCSTRSAEEHSLFACWDCLNSHAA